MTKETMKQIRIYYLKQYIGLEGYLRSFRKRIYQKWPRFIIVLPILEKIGKQISNINNLVNFNSCEPFKNLNLYIWIWLCHE